MTAPRVETWQGRLAALLMAAMFMPLNTPAIGGWRAPPPDAGAPVSESRTQMKTDSRPVPPPMPRRAIIKPDPEPPGKRLELNDGAYKFLLFILPDYLPPASGEVELTVHFHAVPWFVIDEHLRRGLKGPLLIAALGEGSAMYARPFAEDGDRFDRLLRAAAGAIGEATGRAGLTIGPIDVTSFSAGYGAVRELAKQDRYWKKFRRVILSDSLYAGWDPATTRPGAASRPATEHIEPWRAIVQSAARGERTFVLTHSQVPTRYANTEACGLALIELAGAQAVPVNPGDLPATLDPEYPLVRRADLGGFHVWTYAGQDAGAHLTHVRHMADVWKALDASGAK